MNLKIFLSEFIGSFALLFVGVAAIASGMGNIGVSLSFGLIIATMISIFGPISLAHFNPAVSFGFYVLRYISFREMLLYWLAELSGAVFGVLALKALIDSDSLFTANYGATMVSSNISSAQAFGIELIISFFLLLVILGSVLQNQKLAAIYIGSTVALASLSCGALTGASMNPARSFAPALLSGLWINHWIYWLAPLLAATVAALLAKYLFEQEASKP